MKESVLRIGRYRLVYGYLIAVLCIAFSRQGLFWPGVLLALLGIALRIWAAGCIEKDSRLAMNGPYALTRNPLYLGSFIMGLGMIAAIRLWWMLPVYTLGFAIFYWPTILSEETKLTELFGEEYLTYRRQVPAFFPWKPRMWGGGFQISNVIRNREHRYALVSLSVLALLEIVGLLRSAMS
ncbi:MAG: isoprenylcysteine carboxylmethyltransferase family protein [Armatimonadetes bacterium]|nr:isoprenylcysteine carboxylmethyltransferase family protein [Armatimonadota bacterium]